MSDVFLRPQVVIVNLPRHSASFLLTFLAVSPNSVSSLLFNFELLNLFPGLNPSFPSLPWKM